MSRRDGLHCITDTGLLRFNPGLDNGIELTHGPTDSDHGNLDLVLDDICAALGA